MGLLDFFSKNGSTTQSDSTTTPSVPDFAGIQQSYTNQSLANVSYPMANSNPYGAANPVPAPANPAAPVNNVTAPVDNNFQNVQMPGLPSALPVSPTTLEVPDIMQQSVAPQLNVDANVPTQDSPELPPYDYVDPSKHPVIPTVVPDKGHIETMPEGIKVTTYEGENPQPPVAEEAPSVDLQPEVNSGPTPEVLEPLPPANDNQFQNSNEAMSTGFMPIQNPLETDLNNQITTEPYNQEVTVANTLESSSLPVNGLQSSTMDSNVPVTPEVTMPNELSAPELVPGLDTTPGIEANPSLVGVIPVDPQPPVVPEPISDNTNVGLEIGVGVEGASGTDVEPSNQVIESPTVSEETPNEEPTINMTPVLEPEVSTQISMPESEVDAPADVVVEEIPVDKTSTDEILPDTVISQPEVEEITKEAEIENFIAPAANFEMSYFKTVGFIGLNTPQPNSKVVEKVTDLATKLAEHAEVFILDSAKGYARSIFESGKQKQIEVMGMFLKPFHSEYSDEADLGDYEDFTVMMFSSSADKIKNVIKESDILIMPEVTGLNNLSTLFDIWSTNSMYAGQHKPLLLIGKGWTNILTQLKSLFKLSDSDLAFVTVCQTTDEALSKITELDSELIKREVKQPRRIIDLREEDDEEGLFV